MTHIIGYAIVTMWAQLAVAHATIAVLLGRPWKRPDHPVSWILTGLAVAGALENANLFVAAMILHHLNLGVTLAAYMLSAGVIDALLWLLIRMRWRRRKDSRDQPSSG